MPPLALMALAAAMAPSGTSGVATLPVPSYITMTFTGSPVRATVVSVVWDASEVVEAASSPPSSSEPQAGAASRPATTNGSNSLDRRIMSSPLEVWTRC
jgi:hypothetical protein